MRKLFPLATVFCVCAGLRRNILGSKASRGRSDHAARGKGLHCAVRLVSPTVGQAGITSPNASALKLNRVVQKCCQAQYAEHDTLPNQGVLCLQEQGRLGEVLHWGCSRSRPSHRSQHIGGRACRGHLLSHPQKESPCTLQGAAGDHQSPPPKLCITWQTHGAKSLSADQCSNVFQVSGNATSVISSSAVLLRRWILATAQHCL